MATMRVMINAVFLYCCCHPSALLYHCLLQAQKLVQAAEPEDVLAGLPLPLLAQAAGHWKARTQQHQRRQQPPPAAAAAGGMHQQPLSPLEELLGRGRSPPSCMFSSALIILHPYTCPRMDEPTVNPGRPEAHLPQSVTLTPSSLPARPPASGSPPISHLCPSQFSCVAADIPTLMYYDINSLVSTAS